MKRITLEVCVETVADAVAAEQGGADQLELCSALDLGGLTPTLGMYLSVRDAVRLPVVIMLRPRTGHFVYTADELDVMHRDLKLFRPHHPAGFVFGPLRPDGTIDRKATADLRSACREAEVVFHRAFDETSDPVQALEELIGLDFTRVLTSGGHETAVLGVTSIARSVQAVAGRIQVMACGAVRAEGVQEILEKTGCSHLHGSFAEVRGGVRRTNQEAVAAARRVLDHRSGFETNASG